MIDRVVAYIVSGIITLVVVAASVIIVAAVGLAMGVLAVVNFVTKTTPDDFDD